MKKHRDKINYGFPYAVFDMDGTLVDSMKYWYDLGKDYLISKGKIPEADVSEVVANMTMTESAEYFIKKYGIADGVISQLHIDTVIQEINLLIEENYRSHIQLKPGVYDYLYQMYHAGVRMCIATTTSKYLAEIVCQRTGIRRFFSCILSSDEMGSGKHSPEIYYEAVKRLQENKIHEIEIQDTAIADIDTRDIDIKNAVIYEDAEYAVRTVLNAQMNCVIVQDAFQCGMNPELYRRSIGNINDFRSLLQSY